MDKAKVQKRLREACAALELEEIPSRLRRLLDDDPPPPKFPGGMGARSAPRSSECSEEQQPRRLRA